MKSKSGTTNSKHKSDKELREIERIENEAWIPWHPDKDPVFKFALCAANLLSKSRGRKFSDVPDFFNSRDKIDLYFEMLCLCAGEYPDAAKRLHLIATAAVTALHSAAEKAPANFRTIANLEICFPGIVSHHPDFAKNQKLLMGKIGLGKSSGFNLKGKPFSLFSTETRIAYQLADYINRIRNDDAGSIWSNGLFENKIKGELVALPPFSRQTYKQWWKTAEKMFIHRMGENFEDSEEFKSYWRGDAYKEQSPNNPGKKVLMRNHRALIRRDIKKRIQQAFRSIAKKSSAVS